MNEKADEGFEHDHPAAASLLRVVDELQARLDTVESLARSDIEASNEDAAHIAAFDPPTAIALLDEIDDLHANPRDEYHTMDELYRYRMLYNALLANLLADLGRPVHKSWRHATGEECFGGGWFIVTMQLPTGQVSNHYKAEHWDLFRVPEQELADEWDGHTPEVAADRMERAARGEQA